VENVLIAFIVIGLAIMLVGLVVMKKNKAK